MPLVIYIFSICAFALGLTEFLVIGLVSAISVDLHSSIESVGLTVTFYALGATIGAPFLTAITTNWNRKTVMIVTMTIFTIGSLGATLSTTVLFMMFSRFISGLAHGVFLAVAASVATQLVNVKQRGSAVALVFAGLTLALAFGVPIGTYLGSIISWRMSFFSVIVFGFIGLLGIIFFMPYNKIDTDSKSINPLKTVGYIFNPILLLGTAVTILGYSGAFTLYTYVSPILLTVTMADVTTASYIMLIYGLFAAVGNFIGGKITDRIGVDYAVGIIMILFTITLLCIYVFSTSLLLMSIMIACLGLISYAAVPAMQSRVISLANTFIPEAAAVASGLNIAGFNSGIAIGSSLGALIIKYFGINYLAPGGAMLTLIGFLMMYFSVPSKVFRSRSQSN